MNGLESNAPLVQQGGASVARAANCTYAQKFATSDR